MCSKILITGGAGFIGSHLTDKLIELGYSVRILDSLHPQVHGDGCKRPTYLHPDAELVVGDVRNGDVVRKALSGIDAVFHLAARVGVGQSMYLLEEYTSVNNTGTAVLLDAVAKRPLHRLVVASSMSVYGEGLYRSSDGTVYPGTTRSISQLRSKKWEIRGPENDVMDPIATPETKSPTLESVYALTKYDQERLAMIVGRAYGVPTVALRLFNVYGPRQALSNPYTGVLAIFASRLLAGLRPVIFEDGGQKRDFVSVHDVVQACVLALVDRKAPGSVMNVGSGRPETVLSVAMHIAQAMGKSHLLPEFSGNYRMGDIRHCFADISLAKTLLGYRPTVSWRDGITELVTWLESQAMPKNMRNVRSEIEVGGLTS